MTLSSCRKTRGLSIVELIVALGILSFGAFGIYESMLAAGSSGRVAEIQIERDWLAQQELAQLLAAPYAQLAAWNPAAGPEALPGHDHFLRQFKIEKNGVGLLKIEVQVGPADLRSPATFADGMTIVATGVKAP